MKNIFIIISLVLIINSCKSQNNKAMEKFDIESFKKNKISEQNSSNEYYKKDGTRFTASENGLGGYNVFEYPPEPNLYYIYKSFHKNLFLKSREKRFIRTGFRVGIGYEYDENGNIIKTIDYDKPFTYTLDNILKYCKDNKIDVYNMQTFIDRSNPIQKETDALVWIIRYLGMYDEKHGGLVEIILDGKTGEKLKVTIQHGKGEEGTTLETLYDINDEKKKASAIYMTHKGKSYTQEEWKAFEQEHHNEYLRKKGREDEIQPFETPKTDDNKRNFLADEDDIKPQKKKGFWDSLFD
ncbi:MAG TPA: hypothetical protein VF677_04410 [Flavobacterium sp.]|jgi:hypothetical protein